MDSYVFDVTVKPNYGDCVTRAIVSTTAEKAIERARVLYRKHNNRWDSGLCVTQLERGVKVYV
jgi:hypothetical protein